MSDEQEIPDLLPFDLMPKAVLTPGRILKFQAELIHQRTGGQLQADIQTSVEQYWTKIDFFIAAPRLAYSARLFYCHHKNDLPYPISVHHDGEQDDAVSQADFNRAVASVFQSGSVRAIFQSLIARIEELDYQYGKSHDSPSEADTV